MVEIPVAAGGHRCHTRSVRTPRFLAICGALAGLALVAGGVAAGGPGAAANSPLSVFEYTMEIAAPGPEGWDYGTIHLYAVDDGGDMAARQAEGRAAMLARFPGAVALDDTGVTAAFRLFPTPVRWPQPAASWLYNPAGSTPAMPAKSALEAITLGAEGWNNAGGSGFHFDFLGETDTPTGCNGDTTQYAKDGKNVVGWGHIVGGHLGFSCHWRGASLVEATPYFAIQEIDIVFEPIFAYSAGSLQALALHEFGHALGLDHTEAPACPGKAMCSGAAAMLFTEPQQDDIFGVVALYGVAATPTPTPQPTPAVNRPYQAFGPAVARD